MSKSPCSIPSTLVWTILMSACIQTAYSLECYVCTTQEHNDDKCIKTVNTCLPDQSQCMTKVEWRFPPYWTPDGVRIHYITKGCDVQEDCGRKKKNNVLHCKRDWWNDWTCYECCNGPRCNYYVTLGAGNVKPQTLLISLTVILTSVITYLRI